MAALFLGALGIYAASKIPVQTHGAPGEPKPTNAMQLGPMDKYNPSKNDLIRPKAWTYDPRQIGTTARLANRNVKGAYSQEKFLGVNAVDKPWALWKSQEAVDATVQSQTSYIPLNRILDNNYWDKGVKPHPQIRSLGDPQYYYVPPVSRSPV